MWKWRPVKPNGAEILIMNLDLSEVYCSSDDYLTGGGTIEGRERVNNWFQSFGSMDDEKMQVLSASVSTAVLSS